MAQGKITREDIIDSSVESALKQLGEHLTTISNQFNGIIEKSQDLRKNLATDFKVKSFSDLVSISDQLETNIKKLIDSQNNLNTVLTQTGKTGKREFDMFGKALNNLTVAIKEQQAQQERLRKAQAEANETSKKSREEAKKKQDQIRETIRLEKERQAQLEKEARFQQELAKRKITAQAYDPGSIQRLTAENRVLELQMRRLNPLIASERIEFEKLTREYVNNKNRISELNQEKKKSEQSMNGFRAVLGNLSKSVLALGAAYFSLNAVVGLIKKVFRDTKELDKLKLVFNSFIKDTQELANTFDYLGDMASRFGLDLLNLSERYAKFRAATLASKLSLEETRNIFQTFSKASAILGLRTDEVRGVFLALEQMMSKGKITTEELRRQLGERLPGAVNIMAKSMGVATRELDDMLKKGQVISEEVLPNFAAMLEKVYGIENIKMVDTLAASQGRMNKAWLDFVDALNATPVMKESFNSITRFISDITLSIDKSEFKILRYAKNFSLNNTKIFQELDKMSQDSIILQRKNIEKQLDGMYSKFAIDDYLKFRQQQDDIDKKSNALRDRYAKLDEVGLENRLELIVDILAANAEVIEKLEAKKVLEGTLEESEQQKLDLASATNKELLSELSIVEKIQQARKTDISMYKEQLKNAKELFEVSSKLTDTTRSSFQEKEGELSFGRTKTGASEDIDVFEGGIDSYEQFLLRLLKIHGDNVEKRIVLEQELYDIQSKSGGSSAKGNVYTPLEQAKKNMEMYLNEMETAINNHQANMIKTQEMTDEQIKSMEKDKNMELLLTEEKMTKDLLAISNLTPEEREKIEEKITDIVRQQSELRKSMSIDEFNFSQAAQQDYLREQERLRKDNLKMAETESDINLANTILSLQQEATARMDSAKNNARRVGQIESQLSLDILQAIYDSHLEKENLYKDDAQSYKEWELEKVRLQADMEAAKRNEIEKTSKLTTEQLQKQLAFFGESINTAFEVIKSFRQEDIGAAEAIYEREMLMAGTSVRGRIAAEEKLYNAKKNASKRAAKLEKAQALFNIGLSTAQAIISIWAQVPKFDFGVNAGILTAIVSALGAAQMAAVLAQPVPAYAEGGITEGGVAMVGEKGKELMIMPTGERYLSPDTPSLLNLPRGTEIIPHDDTQRLLAQAAKNNFIKETIDLSLTNNYLREIRDRETVNIVGNYKYVNKNGIKGRYAIGV